LEWKETTHESGWYPVILFLCFSWHNGTSCFIKASAGVNRQIPARLSDNERHTRRTGITTVILEHRSQDADFFFFLRVKGKIRKTVVIQVISRQVALFLREKNRLKKCHLIGFLPILPMASSEAAERCSRSYISVLSFGEEWDCRIRKPTFQALLISGEAFLRECCNRLRERFETSPELKRLLS
jgi:hypothetical protein